MMPIAAIYVVPVERTLYTRAADLCCSHSLRAYDAVQLACALMARAGVTPPIFVCADIVLLDIAQRKA
jgi:predicted nucleic acid-binding protein